MTTLMNNLIAKANGLYRSGKYQEALSIYEQVALRPGWARLVEGNISLARKHLATLPIGSVNCASTDSSPKIIVSLTTIRSRLQLVPRVVESLFQQTLRPIRIELNISREPYLLDEGIAPDDPILLDLIKQPLLRVNWVPNIGPYRKLWSFLETHFSQAEPKEKLFVTVDDDTLYPDYFLRQLYTSYLQHNCVIAFRGRHIKMDGGNIAPYGQWSAGQERPSHNNLPTGKDGVLYSTEFFTKAFLDLNAAKRNAPTADDLWIKWHCALNGVPAVILNPEACASDLKSFPLVSYGEDYRKNSLYKVHNSADSQNKNDVTVMNLEAHFNSTLGRNLASLIRNSDAIQKLTGGRDLAKHTDDLPRFLFIEKSSGSTSTVELDVLRWREKDNYRYAIAEDLILERASEFAPQNIGQGIVILEGVTYSSEVAEAVMAFMHELHAQNTLRYTFSLASNADEVISLPRIEFWLTTEQGRTRRLDGREIDKNCDHLTSLKRLRALLEKQNIADGSSEMSNERRLRLSASRGHELFKKKYLNNCQVLNLAHRADRLERASKVFKAMDIQVNRVDAVFGKESTVCAKIFKEVTARYSALTKSEIAPFPVENDMYQSYPNEDARNVHFAKKQGKLLSLGSLGYLLSYRKALVQGLCSATHGNDYITVFDDDVVLHANWDKILSAAYSQLPDNPAVIMLGAIQYHWGRGINWFSENLYCCNGTSIASHATVIHRDYAQFLVDEIEKFILPFDIGPLHYLKSLLFGRSFVIFPNVLIQETSESDIADTKNQCIIGQTKDNVYRWELEKYKVGQA